MQLTLGAPTVVRPAPSTSTVNVDQIIINLNTGTLIATLDDGGSPPSLQQVTFTLPGPTLATVQTFIKNQLAAKLGTTVT